MLSASPAATSPPSPAKVLALLPMAEEGSAKIHKQTRAKDPGIVMDIENP
jgi:hypothetical protein